MSHPLLENSPQVSLVQRNQEIQTLAADTSDEAFAECVRLGRVERRFQDAQAHRLQGRIELAGVNVVAVVDEEPVRFLSRDGLPELLERPVRGGMSGDVAVSDPARSHFHGSASATRQELAVVLGVSISTSKTAENLSDAIG
jgi:hypothetical protein